MARTTSVTMALTAMICLVMLITASASAQECGDYEVTVIAGPQCGDHLTSVVPQAISESGDVVGYTSCNFFVRAFYCSPANGLQFIPMPDGTFESKALAISGPQIVGTYSNPQLELGPTGFLYDYQTDEFTSLGTLEGGNWSEAHDINSSGQIAGYWGNNLTGPWKAFLWENGEMIDIGPSVGGANSRAFGINENGAITGWKRDDGGEKTAFVWEDGKVTELPLIPGGSTSEGRAINDRLDVTGRGWFFDPEIDAFVWRAYSFVASEAFRIDPLPGFTTSTALDIDNTPIVIGGAGGPGSRAFIWEGEVLTDLNDLIPPSENLDIDVARGINQSGLIISQAYSDPLNATVGILLSPIVGPPGDLNSDCQITTADLLLLLGDWGPCNYCPADLDGNGVVSTSDLLILFSNWG